MPTPAKYQADTEARILAAAHRVFLRSGTSGARMQEIADEAGVNKALLHYYFRSKDKLAEKVYTSTASSIFPTIFRTMGSDMPLRDKVVTVVTIQLEVFSNNPYIPLYLASEFQYNEAHITEVLTSIMPPVEQRQAVLDVVQRQLDRGAESGELRPTQAFYFFITLMGHLIFPVLGKPMIDFILGSGEPEWEAFRAQQREMLADRFMASLRPTT